MAYKFLIAFLLSVPVSLRSSHARFQVKSEGFPGTQTLNYRCYLKSEAKFEGDKFIRTRTLTCEPLGVIKKVMVQKIEEKDGSCVVVKGSLEEQDLSSCPSPEEKAFLLFLYGNKIVDLYETALIDILQNRNVSDLSDVSEELECWFTAYRMIGYEETCD